MFNILTLRRMLEWFFAGLGTAVATVPTNYVLQLYNGAAATSQPTVTLQTIPITFSTTTAQGKTCNGVTGDCGVAMNDQDINVGNAVAGGVTFDRVRITTDTLDIVEFIRVGGSTTVAAGNPITILAGELEAVLFGFS